MKQSKKLLSLALALVMGLTLAAPAMAAEETKTEDGKIVILHTNDAHTHIDNTQTVGEGEEAAEVPALRYSTIAGYKATLENVLLVDAGDHVQGTPFGTEDKGHTIIDLMNAAIVYGKDVVILDRPNPNGMYVDGPILDMKYSSGVGRLPIPVVHGLTLGEIALMANGEGWLQDGSQVPLTVIPVKNYTHQTRYELPVAPSPNLKSMKAIYLYPSMCYFEATPVSLGRGTDRPFEMYGHPAMKKSGYSFTPQSLPGAKEPPQLGKLCYGVDLGGLDNEEIISRGIDLSYLIDAYNQVGLGDKFFRSFFELLIGRGDIRKMIEDGRSADEIKATWADDVAKFKEQRRPYLLYEE